MVRKFAKGVVSLLSNISGAEYSERSHQVEYIGTFFDEGKEKDVICTVQMKHYIPRDVYGEAGYFYEKQRKRKVRDKNRNWIEVEETVTYYEMSPADKKFVYVSYVHHHLDQRQISKLSGIPQPYVYRYIKHMKLKPKYPKTPKSERNVNLDLHELLGVNQDVEVITALPKSASIEVADDVDFGETDIDFDKEFHLDPYPSRSEWKVRREELGLKNGENWRNTPYDENPGPKQYGDGSTVRRKKAAKHKRREERKIRNIRKYNLHQNNRYNMTVENQEGDLSKRKFDHDPKKLIPKKQYITKENSEENKNE